MFGVVPKNEVMSRLFACPGRHGSATFVYYFQSLRWGRLQNGRFLLQVARCDADRDRGNPVMVALAVWHQVSKDIQGHRRSGVAQDLLQPLYRDSAFDQHAREEVSEFMRAVFRPAVISDDAGPLLYLAQLRSDVAVFPNFASNGREYEPFLTGCVFGQSGRHAINRYEIDRRGRELINFPDRAGRGRQAHCCADVLGAFLTAPEVQR